MSAYKLSVSHRDALIEELRADPELAAIYLRQAFESLASPDDRAVSLMAIRDVAQAYGGLAKVAEETGMSREALYRALSAKGNPTLSTLLAVLSTLGMRLTVEPAQTLEV